MGGGEGAGVDTQRSGWAVGFTTFAAFMFIMIGAFHVIAGLTGIIEDQFYAVTSNYVFEFDVTAWGWIHLIWGVIGILTGVALFSGAVWARTVGVIVALISAIANFGFIPYYPVWSIVVIAIDVAVIWALTTHGRDIAT
jgi:hypothetical protein